MFACMLLPDFAPGLLTGLSPLVAFCILQYTVIWLSLFFRGGTRLQHTVLRYMALSRMRPDFYYFLDYSTDVA